MQEIEFEVAFVAETTSRVRALKARAGTTIAEALALAREHLPVEILRDEVGASLSVAIYGERVHDLSRPLNAGERIEILRPLVTDPADARRARAANG